MSNDDVYSLAAKIKVRLNGVLLAILNKNHRWPTGGKFYRHEDWLESHHWPKGEKLLIIQTKTNSGPMVECYLGYGQVTSDVKASHNVICMDFPHVFLGTTLQPQHSNVLEILCCLDFAFVNQECILRINCPHVPFCEN